MRKTSTEHFLDVKIYFFLDIRKIKSASKSSLSWSRLIYNKSARHERQECNTSATLVTEVQHEWDMSNMSATRVWHECYTENTSKTRVLHKRHECKKFDFDNDAVKTIFSHYIYYMASEILQREEQIHTENWLLEMSCFRTKMHLKSAPQKLNFLMAKTISRGCTLDCSCKCPCTFPNSYAQ